MWVHEEILDPRVFPEIQDQKENLGISAKKVRKLFFAWNCFSPNSMIILTSIIILKR